MLLLMLLIICVKLENWSLSLRMIWSLQFDCDTRSLLKEGKHLKDDLQMTEQNNFKIVKSFMMEEGGE